MRYAGAIVRNTVLALRNTALEVFQYREVLLSILTRELKVKYKRTSLGYLWSLFNPILQLTVLAAVFSHIVRQGVRDYTLYLFSGLLAWNFFSSTVQTSAKSLLENETFIKKIYLPKILFPLSKLCMRAIEFVFAILALSIIGVFIGLHVKLTLLYLPIVVIPLFIFTLGLSILVSVVTIYFRDIEYLLTVFLQLLYFATPIMYPVSLLPERYQFFLSLNPVYSQLLLFHRTVYEGVLPSLAEWGTAYAVAFLMLGIGLTVMLKLEDDLVYRM